eukprot:TRINITY_DN468_c0_g2_i2.p1 TRINITY_DN468_c0_g2~~TRINITY_DN468_c0_g2_i2.p1  ORF type:complete len:251 (-),score=85.53 TRINITY_DN468_c0_g2_i2:19-771(-)
MKEDVRRSIAEGLGVMFLVFLIIAVTPEPTMAPFAILFAFMAVFTLIAESSGAHVNPAVTLSLFLTDYRNNSQQPGLLYVLYVIMQTLGGLLATVVAELANLEFPVLQPTKGWYAFIIEVIFSMFLCLAVQILCDKKLSNANPTIAGTIVGVMVYTTALSIGQLSGGVINPAIAVGLIVGKTIFKDTNIDQLYYSGLYFIAPFVGGILAHIFYYDIFRIGEPNFAEKKMAEVVEGSQAEKQPLLAQQATA